MVSAIYKIKYQCLALILLFLSIGTSAQACITPSCSVKAEQDYCDGTATNEARAGRSYDPTECEAKVLQCQNEQAQYEQCVSSAVNIPPPMHNSCPANSLLVGSSCVCNSGYAKVGSSCITYTQKCQNMYGINSYGDMQYCYCSTGYKFNTVGDTCIKKTTCPPYSSEVVDGCKCYDGYAFTDGKCLTFNDYCVALFGVHTLGKKNDTLSVPTCYCDSGYEFTADKKGCNPIAKTETIKTVDKPIIKVIPKPTFDPTKYGATPVVDKITSTIDNVVSDFNIAPKTAAPVEFQEPVKKASLINRIANGIKSVFVNIFQKLKFW